MLSFQAMNEMDFPLPIALRCEVTDAIVAGTRHAYEVVADRHDPDEGFDGQTFGFSVYRTSWHHIERRLDDVPDVHHARPNHSLRIIADGYAISGVYRGGDQPNYDIHLFDFQSGTATRARTPYRNMQLLLFGDEEEIAVREAEVTDELTVVHCGNPEDGCTEVFLGSAVLDQDSESTYWKWVRRIFRADGAQLATSSPETTTPTPYPGYEEMPEPAVAVEELPAETLEQQE